MLLRKALWQRCTIVSYEIVASDVAKEEIVKDVLSLESRGFGASERLLRKAEMQLSHGFGNSKRLLRKTLYSYLHR